MNDSLRRRILGRRATSDARQAIRIRRGSVIQIGPRTGEIVVLDDPDDFVIEHLNKAPPVYNHQRAGVYLHVSDLLGKCVRKLALAQRAEVTLPPERIFDGLGLTFAQGDVIHTFIKNRLAAGHPDKVYGIWGCACGQTRTDKHTVLASSKVKCKACGTRADRYHEIAVIDDEYGITGSPDVVLYLAERRAHHLVEIKSINGAKFKELVRPAPDHVLQVTFYWHLMRRAGYSLTDKASILYSNKDYSFKSPYKEFSVDVQSSVSRLESYIEDAKAFKSALGGGDLPVRSMCATRDTPEAKKCPMREECFSRP